MLDDRTPATPLGFVNATSRKADVSNVRDGWKADIAPGVTTTTASHQERSSLTSRRTHAAAGLASMKLDARRLLVALTALYWLIAIPSALAMAWQDQNQCVADSRLYSQYFYACQAGTVWVAGTVLVWSVVGYVLLVVGGLAVRRVVRGRGAD